MSMSVLHLDEVSLSLNIVDETKVSLQSPGLPSESFTGTQAGKEVISHALTGRHDCLPYFEVQKAVSSVYEKREPSSWQ